ncbi:unnamed protein product [Caenorhabditis sp. 36 PRJEB53466]|nr:unnamed protein product [Caenorhabditis sp. 36 PRJEB53466]
MHVKVKRPSQKSHFVKVASEIELFKEIYGENALKSLNIDDATWKILMEMGWEERYTYLMDLRNFQAKSNTSTENDSLPVSTRNELRAKAGEMVYARHFHALLDLYGADFRRQIDINYGRNVMKSEKLRNFIVDCRFLRDYSVASQSTYTGQMQALHDENWLSDRPFSINFVNYQADAQLVDIAKRNLLFQYGPPTKSGDFRPHPFAPTITSRRIEAVERKESLLYISPKATRFVPEVVPANVNGVVVCLSNDASPATSSTSACIADKIVPYRLPYSKYISSERFRPSSVQLWQLGRIFRDYFDGKTMEKCIRNNIDILARKPNEKRKNAATDERNEVFRSAMHHINNCSDDPTTTRRRTT